MNKSIKYFGILLMLTVYLLSNILISTHRHNHSISNSGAISYENIPSLEKNANKTQKPYISQGEKPCFLCSHHNLSTHLIRISAVNSKNTYLTVKYLAKYVYHTLNVNLETKSRAPPIF